MKKEGLNFEQEFQQLMSELIGGGTPVSAPEMLSTEPELAQADTYQSPIRQGGSIISTFMPGLSNKSHPDGHWGIDIQATKGTPVYPIGPGIVIRAGENRKGGNVVTVAHEDGQVTSYYAHLDRVLVESKDEVNINTMIGTVGNTGNAWQTEPHLHYEVTVNGTKIDPQKIIGKAIGVLSKRSSLIKKIIEDLEKFAN